MKTTHQTVVGRPARGYPGNSIQLVIIRAEIARECGDMRGLRPRPTTRNAPL